MPERIIINSAALQNFLVSFISYCLLYGTDWFMGPVSKLVCNVSQHQIVENVSCELALKKEHHQAANEPAEQTETKRGADSGIAVHSVCS